MLDSVQSSVEPTTSVLTPPATTKPGGNHTKPCAPPAGLLAIPDALLRKAHVLFLLSITDNTLARRIKAGDFPAPDMVCGVSPLWRVQTVMTWLAGGTALDLARQHKALKQQIAEATTTQERAELLRQHRHLLAQIRRIRCSKNTPAIA
ncbi:hypothetical protein EVC45_10235 [Paraburkholderia sp. UYCP14C]|uniref:helix-turn-helix transcriptional regulator n=1 Tax=Paraburkholderia sp. UYCP14C TaxID=2511130 RepID=UPI00101F5D7D|nr:hypothetical protein [Paraburkholderia sp. UYCP14C]RZF29967.1 hypothetical protein EVC45_10235 [Paraburkholderia sp. UYCP14C]